MAYYKQEPAYKHGDQLKIGILLINLGTPDAPTASALRPYLKQFLMDRRVVEVARFVWWWILHCIILVVRPKKSAKKYAQVWTEAGSPLLAYANEQTKLLRHYLTQKINSPFSVALGMSYGNPSIKSAIEQLKAQHCNKMLVLPLYPQYAASSTAAGFDAVWKTLLTMRNVPAIRTVKHYHDHPSYINAVAKSIQEHWQTHGKPNQLIMSFHGVPKFHLMKGDPYHCECHKTARLIAENLNLKASSYQVAFQSRFGKQAWLKPYLISILKALGKAKTKRIDIVCPGFSSDCLETLEEIAIEGKKIFQSHGGGEYYYIPALNTNKVWMHAMADIAIENLNGWVVDDWNQVAAKQAATDTATRAKALGAND